MFPAKNGLRWLERQGRYMQLRYVYYNRSTDFKETVSTDRCEHRFWWQNGRMGAGRIRNSWHVNLVFNNVFSEGSWIAQWKAKQTLWRDLDTTNTALLLPRLIHCVWKFEGKTIQEWFDVEPICRRDCSEDSNLVVWQWIILLKSRQNIRWRGVGMMKQLCIPTDVWPDKRICCHHLVPSTPEGFPILKL